MSSPTAVAVLTLAASCLLAATPANASDAADLAPRHTAGVTSWLSLGARETLGVDVHGTIGSGSHRHLQLLFGVGAGHVGFACDSGDACDARELRAFVGGGVIRCARYACASAAVAVAGRRTATLSVDPPDASYQALAELRAAVELGRPLLRLRLGVRLESSSPPNCCDSNSTVRPVVELGLTASF